MRYYLIVANGKHKGQPIPIEGIDLFLIGTGPMCQMKLSAHPDFGEQHFVLQQRIMSLDQLVESFGASQIVVAKGLGEHDRS